jgi:hypothetical protein
MKAIQAIAQVKAIIDVFNGEIDNIDMDYVKDHPELERAIQTIDAISYTFSKIKE